MSDALGACGGGVPLVAGPLSRGRAGLRRHLPHPPRRHRPQLGGALHGDRRPRARRREPPRAGRRDRHRRADLAGAARGRAVRRRSVLPAPPLRARGSRPRRRLRGPVPPAQRPPAAAAHPQGAGRQAQDQHADDGRRAGHAAPAWPRRHEIELLRHRRRAQPPLHRARARPAGLRRQLQARHSALRRAVRRARRDRDDGRPADRTRPPRRQQHGRPRGDRGRPRTAGPRRRDRAAEPRRRVHAPRLALARPLRAPGARDAAALARPRPRRAHVLGPVRRPRPRGPERGRHRRRRVRAHLPLAGRPARVPVERPLDLPRVAGMRSIRGSRRCSRPRCSCGRATTG